MKRVSARTGVAVLLAAVLLALPGCSEVEEPIPPGYLECVGALILADFDYRDLPLAQPHSVQFANQSRNATAWEWQFGDGQTSADYEPWHRYPDAGEYNVTLAAMAWYEGRLCREERRLRLKVPRGVE